MDDGERGNGRTRIGGKQGYQDLVAWQKAMELVTAAYRETRNWPHEEQYGLTSQVRRAAVAIPSNLAEGRGRSGRREFAHHVSIAYGSLCELETQFLIAEQLGYSNFEATKSLMDHIADVRRLTSALLRSLQSSTPAH
ncbi:MAG: four helix bundle protein [Chloroflexi bacterium]|nr:four helix bundle protein [Chloroflexota bacterium]